LNTNRDFRTVFVEPGLEDSKAPNFEARKEVMSKKLVVVTGGTKGIGRATVERFAKEGYAVATCARDEEALDRLKEELEATFDTRIHGCKADLSSRDGINEFVDFVRLLNKELHVLVNNTGQFLPGTIESEEEGVLEKQIETNVYSAYHLTRALLPLLKENAGSYIFNICSIASLEAYAPGASYTISKFAMLGFSKYLRYELQEQGVRVSSVMPGATYTASWEGSGVEEERIMKASDIAQAMWSAYQMSSRTVMEEIVLRPQKGDL